jgi:hypothetical protein
MDGLSAAASVISVIQISQAVLKTVLSVGRGPNASPALLRQLNRFPVYVALLESISVRASSPSVRSEALGSCVRLCHDSLEEVQHYLSKFGSSKVKIRSTDTDKIEKAVGDFIEAVKLLKDFLDG